MRARSKPRPTLKPRHAICKPPLPRLFVRRYRRKIRASAPSRAALPAKRRSRIFPVHQRRLPEVGWRRVFGVKEGRKIRFAHQQKEAFMSTHTHTQQDQFRFIRAGRLSLSPLNLRKTDTEKGIDELAALHLRSRKALHAVPTLVSSQKFTLFPPVTGVLRGWGQSARTHTQ